MCYTVWSHGQEIGETDLGIRRYFSGFRSGWFHPNAAGEKLMPIIDEVASAIVAYMHRNTRDESGRSIIHPEFIGSKAFTDAAEALARADSLGLQLRREDGTIVPTSSIGIRSCPDELALEDIEITDWSPEDEKLDAESLESFDELDESGELEDSGLSWESTSWSPDEVGEFDARDDRRAPWLPGEARDPEDQRYQIHVLLEDDDLIP